MSPSRSLYVFLIALAAGPTLAYDSTLSARQNGEERVIIQTPGGLLPPPRDVMPAPRQASTGTATVAGTVVSADLGRPVRRAVVRLSPVTPGPPRITTADDTGRFTFDGVAAGQFLLSASKPGYLESTFGQRQPGSGRPGTPLSVTEHQRIERLSLPIARGGVLAGSVADDGGEPAYGTEVQAYRFVWQQGERTLRLAGHDSADDRGSFRIGALPPGEYLVLATPAGRTGIIADIGLLPGAAGGGTVAAARIVEADGLAMRADTPAANGYAPVFYPGTTSSASALRLTIGVSEERSGLDLQLPLVSMSRIEGVVVDAAGAPTGTEVRLVDLDMPVPGLGLRSTATGPDGRFVFDNVAPGRYRVQARTGPMIQMLVDDTGGGQRVTMAFQAARGAGSGAGAPGMPFGATARNEEVRWAAAEVTLAGARPDPITLMLQPGTRISGRVTFDAAEPPADLRGFRVVLNAAKPGETGMSSSIGEIGTDGRFTIEGVTPGAYRVNVLSPSVAWRPKSFVVNGRDALDFLLTVAPGDPPGVAELTMTTRTSTLRGTLMDAAGQPAPAHTIVVFADDPAFWVAGSRRVRATRPATDGRFSFSNLPAGSYRLVAVDDLEDGQWTDPDVLKQLAAAALPLAVADGETKVQDLRIAR